MREKFIEGKFTRASVALISTIGGILGDYERQGYDLSLRQLYYQLVSKNLIENTEQSYNRIGELVSKARLAGLLDWSMIVDRGRVRISNPHWDDPASFLEIVAPQFSFDLWADQPCYIEVMVEKQALEGVLVPVCRELDISFTANKGYSSSSAMYGASKRFLRAHKAGKKLAVLYLGDHDPSGIDMSRDIGDRLKLFTGRKLEIDRIALNMPQIDKLNPPENPAKMTDSRAAGYVALYGDSSWELDAIEPRALADIVRKAIKSRTNKKIWTAAIERRDAGRAALVEFAEEYRRRQE